MTKLDWERSGPPRPGSSGVAHPIAVERPYVHVTEREKADRRKAKKEEARARGEAILKAELDEWFRSRGIDPRPWWERLPPVKNKSRP